MATISIVPRVPPADATSATAEVQSAANISSSDLSRSLNPSDYAAPIKGHALRDIAVRGFVTNLGLDFHCDIYELIEQEAASMSKKGLFPSAEEAEHAIWEEFESYVQKADRRNLREALRRLNDPKNREKWTQDLYLERLDELAEASQAWKVAKTFAPQARQAWEKSFANLGTFLAGPKDIYPCENARTERLLRIKHKSALSTYEKTVQRQKDLEEQIRELQEGIQESSIRADIDAACEDSKAFLKHCYDPGKRKFKAYVQFTVRHWQNCLQMITPGIAQLTDGEAGKAISTSTNETIRALQNSFLKEMMDCRASVYWMLGPDPLANPDTSLVEANTRALELYTDLGNPKAAMAFADRVKAKRDALKQQLLNLKRDLRISEGGLKTMEAIRQEHYVKLCENNSGFPKVENQVLANDNYPYEGPHKESVPVWRILFHLCKKAELEIGDIKAKIQQIQLKIRKAKAILGEEDPSTLLSTFTTSQEFVNQFLALRGPERKRMEHFLGMAMGFRTSELVLHATQAEHRQAVILSLAARKLANLYEQVKGNKGKAKEILATVLEHYWNRDDSKKSVSFEGEAHDCAMKRLLLTILSIRGLGDGVALDTIEAQVEPVIEALKRLSKNNLMLLNPSGNAALRKLEQTLEHAAKDHDAFNNDLLNSALDVLQTESEDAHSLVLYAIHWGTITHLAENHQVINNDFLASHEYLLLCKRIIDNLSSASQLSPDRMSHLLHRMHLQRSDAGNVPNMGNSTELGGDGFPGDAL